MLTQLIAVGPLLFNISTRVPDSPSVKHFDTWQENTFFFLSKLKENIILEISLARKIVADPANPGHKPFQTTKTSSHRNSCFPSSVGVIKQVTTTLLGSLKILFRVTKWHRNYITRTFSCRYFPQCMFLSKLLLFYSFSSIVLFYCTDHQEHTWQQMDFLTLILTLHHLKKANWDWLD